MEKHKIILDVDTGTGMPVRDVDDGLAIAMALAMPEFELLGCTTCGGNCRTHESTINTLRILEMAGRGDIPVAEGRENPFLQDVNANFEYRKKRSERYKDFWKNMPPLADPTISLSPLKAHEFIIEMVKKHPGEVTIVKEGSLTNLALALLVEPEIAPLVKEVVHMGGRVGTIDWDAEETKPTDRTLHVRRDILHTNTEFDPEATVIVIRSGIPFRFVTGISQDVLLTPEDVDRIETVGTDFHTFLAQTSRPWVDFNIKIRHQAGAPMWDPFTLAVLADPDLCYFVNMCFHAERFLAREQPYLFISPDSPQVGVSMGPVRLDPTREMLLKAWTTPLS